MKRILVTGATGFIGRHTLPLLRERGFETHATCVEVPTEVSPETHWHEYDLLSQDLDTLCGKIGATHLLHLAWYVHPKDYKESPENQRWHEASIRLLKAFHTHGGQRAVFAGTNMEYDWHAGQEFLHETRSPLAQETLYARMKNQTRADCESYCHEVGMQFAWGRIFHLYGPGESPMRLVPKVISALVTGTKPTLDPNNPSLDFTYVKDVAGAFAALVDCPVNGTINIASGKATSLSELAKTIADITDTIHLVETTPPGPVRVVADITRLTKEVGWQHHYDLVSGLRETVASIRQK